MTATILFTRIYLRRRRRDTVNNGSRVHTCSRYDTSTYVSSHLHVLPLRSTVELMAFFHR